jgi:alpha-glucosidase (family GH31 glycosyl hydrolase)
MPVARPLFFAAPADIQARKAEEQWLLGDAVLVSPVLRQGATEVRCCGAPFPCLLDVQPRQLLDNAAPHPSHLPQPVGATRIAQVQAYFPAGSWHSLFDASTIDTSADEGAWATLRAPLGHVPVHVRFPMCPAAQLSSFR